MRSAYLTALGKFLPGPPVSNDEMEDYLGRIHGKRSRARARILKQNGIEHRHYAIDKQQQSQYSNAEMAALAVKDALAHAGGAIASGDLLATVDFLAAATSQGDFPLPGFASFVQAELALPPCEIASHHGICVSGVAALKHAALQIESGGKSRAVACASEFASRLLKSSRYEAQRGIGEHGLSFDAEFLRWMLSDGGGAALVEPQAGRGRLALKVEWIELRSYASRFAPCMYVGPPKNGVRMASWLDYPSYQEAACDGAINLRQDIRMLDDVVKCAVDGALAMVEEGRLNPRSIDWLVAHYSSNTFLDQSYDLAVRGGIDVPRERWFSNLRTKGNIGSASIYVLLEELLNDGPVEPGQNIFCVVPESGRFQFGYLLLKVVEGANAPTRAAALPPEHRDPPEPRDPVDPPQLAASADPLAQSLVRQLARVWFDFDARLQRVPIVERLNDGRFTVEDYKALLFNLRQQVIDGSRWISRAASNVTGDYFAIRSAFISHSQEEHRDYEMLERNYVSVGGSLEEIRGGRKNVGSEALSAYILQKASVENPFDLVGAMFIVEGLGQRVARKWGLRICDQLGLAEDQASFFLYHGESDVRHFSRLDLALSLGILDERRVAGIVKCAKVVARLYVLQLEEIGNF
jgi:3-oxoacyl-[acyl-carrier-protein] synthase-3